MKSKLNVGNSYFQLIFDKDINGIKNDYVFCIWDNGRVYGGFHDKEDARIQIISDKDIVFDRIKELYEKE